MDGMIEPPVDREATVKFSPEQIDDAAAETVTETVEVRRLRPIVLQEYDTYEDLCAAYSERGRSAPHPIVWIGARLERLITDWNAFEADHRVLTEQFATLLAVWNMQEGDER